MSIKSSIHYGTTEIPFQLEYVQRKSLEIAVLPNSTVHVKAPVGSALEAIHSKVLKRSRWILKQKAFFAQFHPRTTHRQFLPGETHLYLGRQYRLKVQQGAQQTVKLTRGYIIIESPKQLKPDQIQILLSEWYRQKASTIFQDIYADLSTKWIAGKESKPRLAIKAMRTRWGSLSKGGILTLNPRLVLASKECIEYVICHELCHVKHHDHSPAFYRLLQSRIPDWEKRKSRLEKMLV